MLKFAPLMQHFVLCFCFPIITIILPTKSTHPYLVLTLNFSHSAYIHNYACSISAKHYNIVSHIYFNILMPLWHESLDPNKHLGSINLLKGWNSFRIITTESWETLVLVAIDNFIPCSVWIIQYWKYNYRAHMKGWLSSQKYWSGKYCTCHNY